MGSSHSTESASANATTRRNVNYNVISFVGNEENENDSQPIEVEDISADFEVENDV
jgi:hypothetical protein